MLNTQLATLLSRAIVYPARSISTLPFTTKPSLVLIEETSVTLPLFAIAYANASANFVKYLSPTLA